jgi:hypothetical protein
MAQAPLALAKRKVALLLLFSFFILSAVTFAHRIADCFRHPELQNTTDMEIFSGAGKNYLNTGHLYIRSNNYAKAYAPGEGIYKFPPAYQLSILPLLKYYPDNFQFLLAQRVIQLFLYLSASIILIATIGRHFIWHKQSIMHKSHRYAAIQFILISLIFTFWSMGFFESFSGIEPEIPVYFLLVLTLYFSTTTPLLSGAFIAMAAAIKIYPIFIILYFVLKPNTKALFGFITGFLLITLFSIYYIGIGEHIFYLKNILPVLLQENAVYHIQNKTIESFFHAVNLIPVINGKITEITRIIALITIVMTGWVMNRKPAQHSILLFGMLISGLLLCLSNYWQQYQIILAIPLFALVAYSLKKRMTALYIIIVITGIAMSIQEAWFQDLKESVFNQMTDQLRNNIYLFEKSHQDSDPVLFFFPFMWVLYCLRDFVFLSPAILFATSVWILVNG